MEILERRTISDATEKFLCFGFFPDPMAAKLDFEHFMEVSDLEYRRRHLPSDIKTIGHLLRQAVARAVDMVPGRPLGMGISSGLDSRAIFYGLSNMNMDVSLYTFGTIGMIDFDFCKFLERKIRGRIEFLNASDLKLNVSLLLQGARDLSDFIPSPRLSAIQRMREKGETELHGYLNDVATGATLPGVDLCWNDALNTFINRNDAFGFHKYFQGRVARHLPSRPFRARCAVKPYDQLNIFIHHQQRIRISSNDDSRVFPLEDPDWIYFWMSRSGFERYNQNLYLRFLRGTDSEVFFDVASSSAGSRSELRQWQLDMIYGSSERTGVVSPEWHPKRSRRSRDGHFCAMSCFHENIVFRQAALELVENLKTRKFFRSGFVDCVMSDVLERRRHSNKAFKGLLSTELAFSAGKLSPE